MRNGCPTSKRTSVATHLITYPRSLPKIIFVIHKINAVRGQTIFNNFRGPRILIEEREGKMAHVAQCLPT